MMPMLLQFANVLVFLGVGVLFLSVSLLLSSLIRPSKYSEEKLIPYECGENPVGSPWIQFNIRFYVFALIFIIFDVDRRISLRLGSLWINPQSHSSSGRLDDCCRNGDLENGNAS